MYADDEQAEISASTTLGELARIVDPHKSRPALTSPEGGPMVVDTAWTPDAEDEEILAGIRARRLPYVWAGITAAAGWGAWWTAEAVTAAHGSDAGTAVAAATWIGSAAALPLLRAACRHRIPEAWRRRWWLAGICSAGWVDVAVAHGPDSWTMTGVLVVGAVALSARWWDEWEVPNPGVVDEPGPDWEPQRQEMSRAAQIEQAWTERVAAGRNPVAARARLTGREELPAGVTRWLVELDPEGNVGATELVTKPAPIARALRMKPSNVIVERVPGDGDREDRALLSIVTRDLLAAGVPYRGPRYHHGRIPVGSYADATGEAEYVAVDEVGARPGLVTGDPGSGKTALLEAIVMGKLQSGVWKVLFGDGDPSGGSSPTLNRVADWAEAGPEGVLRQLRAVEALIKVRSRIKPTLVATPDGELRPLRPDEVEHVDPVREMRPCRSYPGYAWVLDELHRLSHDDTLRDAGFIPRLEQVARIGRKYGVVPVVGTQSLVGGDFGGSTQLRAYLATRNAFVMRSTNRSEQHAINGIDVAPGTLPSGGGYAFSVGAGRMALMRVAWSATMADWASGFPDCPGDLDSEMAVALYRPQGAADPAAVLSERKADLDAWRAAVRAGHNPDDEPPARAKSAAAKAGPSVGGVSVPTALGGNVVPIHRPATASAAPVPVRSLDQLGPPSANATRVLEYLRSHPGPRRAAEVVEGTGLSKSAVSKAFKQLAARKLVRWEHGVAEARPRGTPP